MQNVIFSMSHFERFYAGVVLFTIFLQFARMAVYTFGGKNELLNFLRWQEKASLANAYKKFGWLKYTLISLSILVVHMVITLALQWYVSMCFITLYYFILACWQYRRMYVVAQDATFLSTFA